jgi:hypothetical protein
MSTKNYNTKQGGFIGTILLIIIALILLKYFLNWSVFDAASTEQGHDTIIYIRDVLNTAWNYIVVGAKYLWNLAHKS